MEITISKTIIENKVTLKPCPFCGSETLDFSEEQYGRCCVVCKTCGAHGGRTSYNADSLVKNRELAIQKWNSRS